MSTDHASALAGRGLTRRGLTSARLDLGQISEVQWLWMAVLVFVGVSAWWLTQDSRIPDFDSGTHMAMAFQDHYDLATGHLTAPFTEFTTYPPLVHLVGALTIFILGMHPMALILSSNVVFVPLLAFGCYGTGKIVAGPRAGLLAGLFALGTPMFVSMMHEYDLDPPQAAMVAVSVWAILASCRFKRLGISALAGVLCGLALMTKETSVVFLGGLLIAVVIRGGWRNWLGLIVFAFALENVAGFWYAYHFSQLGQAFNTLGGIAPNAIQAPPRFSLKNGAWYFWDLVNQQTLAPLALAFLIGAVVAIRGLVRSKELRRGYLPELLTAAVISYLGMTYLTHKDPRYTLPALVYLAVIGTYWIPGIARRRLRLLVAGLLVAVCAINFAGMSFGIGGSARALIPLPNAQVSIIYQRQLTLYEDAGWVRGGPKHNGDVLGLLKGLHAEGVRTITLDPSADQLDFSSAGIIPLAESLNMNTEPTATVPADGAYLLIRPVLPGNPAPCQRLVDTSGHPEGIYVIRGSIAGLDAPALLDPSDPAHHYKLVCPGRAPVLYPPVASPQASRASRRRSR